MTMNGMDVPPPFALSTLPQQRVVAGAPFPLVLSPSPQHLGLSVVLDAITQNLGWLAEQLCRSGAILLRGFPLHSASDFNDVVEAFGYEELPYVGGAAPRTNVVGRVFTANESPPDQKIPFHHEMAQVPEYPSILFFFCETKPAAGGETPIVLSHLVYDRMSQQFPDFVQKLEKDGVIYTRILGVGDDPSSPIGRGWQSTFFTQDKEEAEKRASRLGVTLEWLPDGCVKTVSGPLPGVKIDQKRGRKVWFNSMVAAYIGWEDTRNDRRKAVTFGDCSPLPEDVIHGCLSIQNEECVAIPWQPGDVLILDNVAVQHSRRPFTPPRRVLAALCK
eukprot:c20889_g1_i1 orf=364-1359(-)